MKHSTTCPENCPLSVMDSFETLKESAEKLQKLLEETETPFGKIL